MERSEMKHQTEEAGDFTEPVMSPPTADEQGSEQPGGSDGNLTGEKGTLVQVSEELDSGGCVGSLDGKKETLVQIYEELENPVDRSKQPENQSIQACEAEEELPNAELVQKPEVQDPHSELVQTPEVQDFAVENPVEACEVKEDQPNAELVYIPEPVQDFVVENHVQACEAEKDQPHSELVHIPEMQDFEVENAVEACEVKEDQPHSELVHIPEVQDFEVENPVEACEVKQELENPKVQDFAVENPVEASKVKQETSRPDSELVPNPDVHNYPVQGAMNSTLVEQMELDSNMSEIDSIMKLPRYTSDKLYVVDLHPLAVDNVGELEDLFSQVGKVAVVKVNAKPKPADTAGKPSLCSAYVNYHTVQDACSAWQTFNYYIWKGIPMRIMFSNLNPATRYNEKANIIVMNLAESIDSHSLHHTFCIFGVVLSSKVELDQNGKSTGRGYIQFQDEEDAERAIKMVNNKMLEGRVVYVGPFIRRTDHSEASQMNKNPIDLNPAHNPHVDSVGVQPSQVVVKNKAHPIEVVGVLSQPSLVVKNEAHTIDDVAENGLHYIRFGSFEPPNESGGLRFGYFERPVNVPHDNGATNEAGSSSESTANSNTNLQTPSPSEVKTTPSWSKERTKFMKRGTSSERNKARKLAIIENELKDILKESEAARFDPSQVPSPEPWPPQPWSVEILKATLAKAQFPEERLAMLGVTLLPLVANHTKCLATDVTNELVKMDMRQIEKIMKLSEEALHQKVMEVKQVIFERIKNQPPFVPTPVVCSWTLPAAHYGLPAVPNFPVPLVPEFLEAPALPPAPMPWWFPYLPCLPLPRPFFPPCVMNYPFRRGLGTGYYEPRVMAIHGLYKIAELAEGDDDRKDEVTVEARKLNKLKEQAEAEKSAPEKEQAQAKESAPRAEEPAQAEESVQAEEPAQAEEQAQAEEPAQEEEQAEAKESARAEEQAEAEESVQEEEAAEGESAQAQAEESVQEESADGESAQE